MTRTMPFRRGEHQPTNPEPDPEEAELALHAHNMFQVALVGLTRLLRSAALDAQLDAYLALHPRGPRPDEETPNPALDRKEAP